VPFPLHAAALRARLSPDHSALDVAAPPGDVEPHAAAAALVHLGLQEDEGLEGVQALRVAGTPLGAAGAVALAPMLENLPSLLRLDLAGAAIGDAGVRALAHTAPEIFPLRELNLSSNGITAAGEAALGALLRPLSRLTALRLADNAIFTVFAAAARGTHSAASAAAAAAAAPGGSDPPEGTLEAAIGSMLQLQVLDLSDLDAQLEAGRWSSMLCVASQLPTLTSLILHSDPRVASRCT
jgi:Leucine Rich repeat